MRARFISIVLTLFMAALTALMTAGTASASNPTLDPAAASSAHLRADDSASAEGVKGKLTGPVGEDGAKGPVPGVTIIVSQNGTAIGSAVTGEDGAWEVPVPEPGAYDVELDTSTLPNTVRLRDEGAAVREGLRVQPNRATNALFPLVAAGDDGAAAPTGVSRTSYVLSVLLAGLRFGLIIAMTAIGLSLVFGTTGLINFAHGEFVAIGAVVAYVFGTAPLRWPFLIAIALAVVAVGALGGLTEFGIWRPLRKRGVGLIQMFIISIGLSLLLRHTVLLLFGSQRSQYLQSGSGKAISLGPVDIQPRDLIIIIVSIVVLVSVAVMLQKTRMGKAMRALSDNRDLAEASGIDVQKVIVQVWVLGGGLAALGGVFYGLTAAVYWDMGFNLLLLMFAGIILGGLGSAYGAVLGSIVIGIVAQGSTIWFPSELQNAWAMVILVVVLLVRPQGILGRLQRAG